VPSDSNGQALSYREFPPDSSSLHDIVVQEGWGKSALEDDQWEPSADLSTFLPKVLQSTQAKERLGSLEEDPL